MIHQAEDAGDILVFLTGEEEIEDACRKIKAEADDLAATNPDLCGPLRSFHSTRRFLPHSNSVSSTQHGSAYTQRTTRT